MIKLNTSAKDASEGPGCPESAEPGSVKPDIGGGPAVNGSGCGCRKHNRPCRKLNQAGSAKCPCRNQS